MKAPSALLAAVVLTGCATGGTASLVDAPGVPTRLDAATVEALDLAERDCDARRWQPMAVLAGDGTGTRETWRASGCGVDRRLTFLVDDTSEGDGLDVVALLPGTTRFSASQQQMASQAVLTSFAPNDCDERRIADTRRGDPHEIWTIEICGERHVAHVHWRGVGTASPVLVVERMPVSR